MGEVAAAPVPAASREADAELTALRGLARLVAMPPADNVNVLLERVAELARELLRGRYAAVTISDADDGVEGFFVAGLDDEALHRLKRPPQGHGPLGVLRREGRPVRIDDLEEHAASFGFPPRHPEMTALCGVPLWVRGQVRGSLYVTDKEGTLVFDERDEAMLVLVARHATRIVEEKW